MLLFYFTRRVYTSNEVNWLGRKVQQGFSLGENRGERSKTVLVSTLVYSRYRLFNEDTVQNTGLTQRCERCT